jgi:hypothetical protein
MFVRFGEFSNKYQTRINIIEPLTLTFGLCLGLHCVLNWTANKFFQKFLVEINICFKFAPSIAHWPMV